MNMKSIIFLFTLILVGRTGLLAAEEEQMTAHGTFEVKVTPQQTQEGDRFAKLFLAVLSCSTKGL
jgi:hypothetical protein